MASTLGQRLRALRVERGLSQAQLAGTLVSPSYVSLIESGRRSPEHQVLDGLARRLGCSVSYLESGLAPEQVSEQRLHLQFASIARLNGDLEAARAGFAELRASATGEIRHEASWGLAQTLESLGCLHEALSHVEELLEAARAGEPGAPGLLALLIAQCRLHRTGGDYARAIEVGEAARREVAALSLAGTEEEIKLAATLVACYYARGDMFAAQHLASQVIEQAERLGSRQAQGNAYWSACTIAAARGQLPLALELATKTLALLSETSPGYSLAGMRVTRAWLLMQCDPPQLDEADAMLARAHDVLVDESFTPHLVNCETEMGRCALLRGDYATAAGLAEQAMARCDSADVAEFHQAQVIRGLALILGGEVAEGAQLASAAAANLAQLDAGMEAARAWREIAEALLQRGCSGQAIEALRSAADCAGVRSAAIRADQPVPAAG